METVNRNIHALLNSIQKCQVYKDFKKQEAILNKNPELAQRVQHFRAENFKLQNEGDPENILAKAEQLARESEELCSFPEGCRACSVQDDAENLQDTDRRHRDEYSPDLRKENQYGRHERPDGGGRRSSGRRIF